MGATLAWWENRQLFALLTTNFLKTVSKVPWPQQSHIYGTCTELEASEEAAFAWTPRLLHGSAACFKARKHSSNSLQAQYVDIRRFSSFYIDSESCAQTFDISVFLCMALLGAIGMKPSPFAEKLFGLEGQPKKLELSTRSWEVSCGAPCATSCLWGFRLSKRRNLTTLFIGEILGLVRISHGSLL